MDITYLGHSSFLIKSKDAKIITDPFDPKKVGLPYPKQSADIVTVSHHHYDHDYIDGLKEYKRIFDWPGEFEMDGVRIFGFQSFHDDQKGSERGENVIFRFETEGLSVVHMGDIGHKPDDKLIDQLGDIDILMIPVGGHFTISSAEAADIVKKLDPAIVIPMHFQNESMDPSLKEKLEPVSAFVQKMASEAVEPIEKLTVKKEELGETDMKVVLLQSA
jgi:L-ascorbate metabolism protein UlaG (beta-lactamase superfamily)